MPRKYIIRTCLHCGVEFPADPSNIKRGGGKYCSQRCHGAHRRRAIAERFWEKVDRSGECWLWTGTLDGHGYG
ncbi:MAG: hypothetical protein ACTHMJ_01035, partial [Thermomicrobiales bacterium]